MTSSRLLGSEWGPGDGCHAEGLCPTYIPEELKDRFVMAGNISEAGGISDKENIGSVCFSTCET